MDTIYNAFEMAVDSLLSADPRNSSKGKKIKEWAQLHFNIKCSVSHVTDARAIGNRVSEQMRYNSPLLIFVCDKTINIDTLKGYIESNEYSALNDVLIMSDSKPYKYILLLHYKDSSFSTWIADNIDIPIEKKQFSSNNRKVNVEMRNSIGEMSSSNLNYLTALRTKPFMLLAGISGTGKSRIVRKLAQASVTEELQKEYDPKSIEKGFMRWELHKPANFEIIQVKPNWHNSLEVVGYKSNIGGLHYEFTPFVEFVARAWKHPQIPFFLCLDEMNLAPVEQYFAEFLSAIESRSFENDEYETDPIIKPFIEFDGDLWKTMVNHLLGDINASDAASDSPIAKLVERFKTKGLTLPQNLLVMGTVNMDETTFSFSRKVLDRAMSIVMNTVEYKDFFSGESENDVAEMSDEVKALLINRPIRGIEAEDNEAEEVEKYLTSINIVLEDTPFKLGYRAANEALLYVSAAYEFNPRTNLNDALDEFTLMKVLSRIEGDKRSIGSLLSDLQEVITTNYPKSNDKLQKMAATLQKKQFVSYWT